ncbi:CD225/dispanin family protein [Cellulomonas sp. P5_E12]
MSAQSNPPGPDPAPVPAPAPAPWPAATTPVPPAPPIPAAPVGWVIAAMILFWPTGIPALLASHRAARAAGAADVGTAARESANARRWGIISVIVGAALILLSILVSIAWAVLAVVAVHEHRGGLDWEQRGPGWHNELPFDQPDRPDSGR